jgi:positive regulator of sigma E activity
VAFISLGRAIGAPLATLLFHFGFTVVTVGAALFNLLAFLALRRMQRGLERKETPPPVVTDHPGN